MWLHQRQQAFYSVLFFSKEVLEQYLDLKNDAVRAKKSNYLPTVFIKDKVLATIKMLSSVY
ncbi:hypothetical protein NG798_24675 [Ancylothrix sp. C2]|nr:hypothetical protein [Ancylothrix sp. D3o]MCT7952997.1 hypothetical protein [Ancylothrix sp. D3o]